MIRIAIAGQVCWNDRQRYTEHEHRVVAAGVEAGYADRRIGRWLGRSQGSVRKHRRTSGINKATNRTSRLR